MEQHKDRSRVDDDMDMALDDVISAVAFSYQPEASTGVVQIPAVLWSRLVDAYNTRQALRAIDK